MACPIRRHRYGYQPWPSNDSLTGVTAVSRSALDRHAGSTATSKTLKPVEPILGFGGLRAITADCWVGTDSVFSWAVGNVSTTLAGIIVLLGALIIGAGLFPKCCLYRFWFVTAAELFKPWTSVGALFKTTD